MPKFFDHWIPPFTGWFYDENDTRVNLNEVLSGLTIGGTTPSNIEGLGDIEVGLTEVEIAFTGTTSTIRIQADEGNTGIIYLGKTGVQNDGSNDFARLNPGDEATIEYDDSTNAIYAISDTASQTINAGAVL